MKETEECLSTMAFDSRNKKSYYLSMNVHEICRICLEKGTHLMPIFNPVEPSDIPILIMACASVQVDEDDGLPQYICQKCVARLNLAFQFKTDCEEADTKLRSSLQNVQRMKEANEDYIINMETTNPTDSVPDVTLSNTKHCNNDEVIETSTRDISVATVDSEIQCIIETELHEVVPFHDSESDTNSTINQVTDQVQHIRNEKQELMTSIENQKARRNHKCHICNKVFHRKPSLAHHIRIHTGERPYRCRFCDKRFVNGGHLHTHMRTHTGEKKHICTACPKAFPTAQQLTKHRIAIHTSERPYSCSFCPKKFASSSNLSTHVKIHTGEKNYYCDQCVKAFVTKGQLHQHMLVHTGEKAFLCEYCEKRFSQKAHLVRHSKLHHQTL